MNESEENFSFDVKRLSLIDVSFEDDCLLYDSPSRDLQNFSDNQTEGRSVVFLDAIKEEKGATLGDPLEGGEHEPQPLESSKPEETRTNGKYNLRKSLAWDIAFFTSAGVLEPEELSSIIGGAEEGGKHVLPGIEEDVRRSTDSLSTLASDCLSVQTLEDDLFEDIRASIQKSSKLSDVVNSTSKVGSGIPEHETVQLLKKEVVAADNKLKTKAAPKKPNIIRQASGKITKQVSACTQASQSITTNRESKSSLSRPPKVVGRVSPVSMSTTKRTSLGANHVKGEKDDTRNPTGEVTRVRALGSAKKIVPRPAPPSKSSSGSSVTAKTELPSSHSSFEGSESLPFDSSDKSCSDSAKRTDSRTVGHSPSGSTVKSRLASISKNQSTTSSLSPCLKSMTKLSSSISPSSSISEWSTESLSPTSTLNKRSNSSRSSLDTGSCKDGSGDGDDPQVLSSGKQSNEKRSVGLCTQVPGVSECTKRASTGSCTLHPESIKPSGLRMPSPKIGFFDGVKSAVRTPTGNVQYRSTIPSGLPRSGAGGSNEAKHGKVQSGRTVTVVGSVKIGAQQPALATKPKPSLHGGKPSNDASKVHAASRN